jgi:hypothetical protein
LPVFTFVCAGCADAGVASAASATQPHASTNAPTRTPRKGARHDNGLSLRTNQSGGQSPAFARARHSASCSRVRGVRPLPADDAVRAGIRAHGAGI